MLKLLMKCTDEKNISLAMMGYKIFFSSTPLTLKSKPITGLKIKRKPVEGLKQKNCQLFSGRYSKIEQVVIMNKEKNGIFYDNIKKTGNSIDPLFKIKKIPIQLLESEIWKNLTEGNPFKGKIEDVQKYLQE